MKILQKKIVLRISIFILMLITMDFISGNFLRYIYFNQTSGVIFKSNYTIDKVKTDIIILGSSRANHHYIPYYIENELKMTCYNAGIDGQFIYYHYVVLKCINKRYTPKLVILDISPGEDLLISKDAYDRLDILLPYYRDHKVDVGPILNMRQFENIKLLSQVYPYNHCIFSFEKINKNYIPIELKSKGFRYRNDYFPIIDAIEKEKDYKYTYDKEKLRAFINLIGLCHHNGIRLEIIVSPYYKILSKSSLDILHNLKNIAQKEKVSFCDLSQDTSIINHKELFMDQLHLNPNGAKIFSEKVAKYLKLSQK